MIDLVPRQKDPARDASMPTNISTNSDPLMLKKGASASPATAFAGSVLPLRGEAIILETVALRSTSCSFHAIQRLSMSAEITLPFVTFGDSDTIEVGKRVVPRALEASATQSIISAKHGMETADPRAYEDLLQTGAPVNSGSLGRPLPSVCGQVTGADVAIAAESGGLEGTGFTVPSRIAVYTVNAPIARGRVERDRLGMSIGNVLCRLQRKRTPSMGFSLPTL